MWMATAYVDTERSARWIEMWTICHDFGLRTRSSKWHFCNGNFTHQLMWWIIRSIKIWLAYAMMQRASVVFVIAFILIYVPWASHSIDCLVLELTECPISSHRTCFWVIVLLPIPTKFVSVNKLIILSARNRANERNMNNDYIVFFYINLFFIQ